MSTFFLGHHLPLMASYGSCHGETRILPGGGVSVIRPCIPHRASGRARSRGIRLHSCMEKTLVPFLCLGHGGP